MGGASSPQTRAKGGREEPERYKKRVVTQVKKWKRESKGCHQFEWRNRTGPRKGRYQQKKETRDTEKKRDKRKPSKFGTLK